MRVDGNYRRHRKEGVGSTIKMQVAPQIMALIHSGLELGHAADKVFHTSNVKHSIGYFGLMTHSAITRTSGYVDGIIAALIRFIRPEIFDDRNKEIT